MRIRMSFFRYYNRKYIFPTQFFVCTLGNILNLIVLNGKNMRTRTNCFLTAMAVADLSFFLMMLLPNLEHRWPTEERLRNLYVFLHIPVVAFANWFSAASIWLTVAVTLERLIATRPRRVPAMCRVWNKRRTFALVIIIYTITFILSLYHFAWRKAVPKTSKNDTSNKTTSRSSNFIYTWAPVSQEKEPLTYWYVHSNHLLFGLLVVAGPLILLFILNCIIVYRLRAHNRSVGGSLFPGSDGSSAMLERIRRRERRVTLTVVLLVSVLIIFTLPSGIFSVIEFLATHYLKIISAKRWYWDLGEMCNALVCTGKAINFLLYCSASSDYRRELRNVLTFRRCRRTIHTGDGGTNQSRSRSTSRVSSSCSAHRHRRSTHLQMSEICTSTAN